MTRQVQRVRCPTHGQNAHATELHQTRDGFSFDISGCCDELIERAKQVIR
jgi:hypothetical protein